MAWLYLLLAGCLEIIWAVTLRYAKGFSVFWPTVIVIFVGLLSVWNLSLAVKTIPLGTAYAIWTGIGIVGTVVIENLFFHEPFIWSRAFFISLILIGIIGLRLIYTPSS